MTPNKESFRDRMQKAGDRAIRENLGLFKFAYRFFSVFLVLFAIAWACVALAIVAGAVVEMIRTGQPLIINGERST